MYIQKAEITNIKSIEHFEIEFKEPYAGWHVLIGDNGSGKTTIIRSMALALVGEEKVQALRLKLNEWIRKEKKKGTIKLTFFEDKNIDKLEINKDKESLQETSFPNDYPHNKVSIIGLERTLMGFLLKDFPNFDDDWVRVDLARSTFFSSAYGPYRRFEGGNPDLQKVFEDPSLASLAAHLSAFGEDIALTETIVWLKELFNTSNDPTLLEEERKNSRNQLSNVKRLINSEEFLPNNTKLENVNSKDVLFKDGNGAIISVNQLSDGYRSILSLTIELIRQLVRVYGAELVFKNIEKDEMFIDLPGVVLVDEIDAHLHPTWQTRIGQWFLEYFPKLQFIVTTHSPLVCRACEKGSIWRLAAPGSDEKSGEVTGTERDRLIYGNVLDAYGTEVFGANVTVSEKSIEKQEELVKLNKKKMAGVIDSEEENKLNELRKTFTTDDPIDL